MANLIVKPGWQLPERLITPKDVYANRRHFLRQLGMGSIALMATGGFTACADGSASAGAGVAGPLDTIPANAPRTGYPAAQNTAFAVSERPVTDRIVASSYNNYYEFKNGGDLKDLWELTGDYNPFPTELEVTGLVEKKFKIDLAELIGEMPIEERIYRFRCVEAWAMTVPWTGFPLKKLIERCKPTSKATHVRFMSIARAKEMPGIPATPWYTWPYYEGLRMDEAMNDLAFVATGMYGEPLPKQNGSPWRWVMPWKYGYKGPKAVVKIEFVDRQPKTFWNDLQPAEYSFLSNVNPSVPHPRWSQASERLIGENDRRVPTQLFNGYAEWVGDLYPEEPRR
ncbi:MAG: protein-methionine-sulfoxide reductase catalytic subunit MsrP [Rhodothermales bacterium]|nr:protein-methionine-sulfoxide reductase catalytic subunit MsrP [Rhodothermales bacterium]